MLLATGLLGAWSPGSMAQGLLCVARDEIARLEGHVYGGSVEVYGRYLLVGDDVNPPAVRIYDMISPTEPDLVGSFDPSSSPPRFHVVGSTLFALRDRGGSGCRIFDMSTMPEPTPLGIVNTHTVDIAFKDQYAYLCHEASDIGIYDLSDLANPAFVDFALRDTPGDAFAVEVIGDSLYVADGHLGMKVMDITDPTKPLLVHVFPVDSGAYAHHLVQIENTLHLFASNEWRIYHIGDPANPVLIATNHIPWNGGIPEILDGYLVVAASSHGVWIYDVNEPHNPQLFKVLPASGRSYSVAFGDDYVAIAEGALARVFDRDLIFREPLLSNTAELDSVSASTLSDGLAYTVEFGKGLKLLDISDPSNPVQISALSGPSDASEIVLQGDYAYIAAHSEGLWIVDVSDPAEPVYVGVYDSAGSVRDVVVGHTVAYLADDADGIKIIDIADPVQPTLVSSYDTPGRARGLDLVEDKLYIADLNEGLLILDVSDVKDPAFIGSYVSVGDAHDVVVRNEIAWIAYDERGVGGYYVADPDNITGTGRSRATSSSIATNVEIEGEYLYVGDAFGGLDVYDISNPDEYFKISSYWVDGGAVDIGVKDGIAAVSSRNSGLYLVDLTDCPPEPCLADVNGDGQLSPTDFTAWLFAFRTLDPAADQNSDGQLTPTDFTSWVSNYNAGCEF